MISEALSQYNKLVGKFVLASYCSQGIKFWGGNSNNTLLPSEQVSILCHDVKSCS
jgi:hypothetical protein